MAIVQTYESHLVGIGEPLIGRSDGSDTIKFLAFAQGLSYQYQKDIKRFKQIGKDDFYFNRQTDWADVSVNITQFDSIDDNYDILKNLNIFPSSEEFTSGTYYPFLRNIITGGRNSNGSPIYFITDTGERARNVLGNDDSISRDFTVIDPCYLSSVSWSVAKNTVASFEYSFVGNYMRTGSYTENGDIVWDHIINTGNGDSYISTTGDGDISSTSNEIDVNNVSGLFIGGDTNVGGAPDLGEIRGISWSVSIDRSNVQGLGNPMKYDRKISPEHIGQVTIEYNYEGQEFDLANVADVPYNIRIESKSKNNFFRIFKIENALIESAQLNSSTSGEPDSYSVTLSFKVNKNSGLFYDIQQSESESTTSNDYIEPSAPDPRFIFTVDTTLASPDTDITIGTISSVTYNCIVDWGDGSSDTINSYNDSRWTHSYDIGGQYQIKISGLFEYIGASSSFRSKLIEINNFGDVGFISFYQAFFNCSNLVSVNSAIPILPNTTVGVDISRCFANCSSLETIPSNLFSNCSNTVYFSECFQNCTSLQSIPSGLFSNCTNAFAFDGCFYNCDTLTSIPEALFLNTSASDFYACFAYSQNITSTAANIFPSSVQYFDICFIGVTLNTTDYSNLLVYLEDTNQRNFVSFHGGNSTANASGATARDSLRSDHNWSIIDGDS